VATDGVSIFFPESIVKECSSIGNEQHSSYIFPNIFTIKLELVMVKPFFLHHLIFNFTSNKKKSTPSFDMDSI
jgi:hypothetical protein